MKNLLVIGSTVVDVIIKVDHLPRTQEDIHVLQQTMTLGGCAYNAFDIIRHFQVPCTLFSPIGTGAYGDFVRTRLQAAGVTTPIPPADRDNGCCYCFVEKSGERTFISYHGAEYLFEQEWFDRIHPEEIGGVYICGLEIEETTGPNIVEWLEAHLKLPVYFAPGPRITRIDPKLLARIYALHPVLHLNETEVKSAAALLDASKKVSEDYTPETAAALLYSVTSNDVIVTLGANGAYFHSAEGCGHVAGFPARQLDTIGAGDAHIGAVMACRFLGMSLPDSLRTANRVSARVVETEGARLSDDAFASLQL